MNNLKDKIKSLALAAHAEMIATRRHLHAHPELSYQEVETGKYIAAQLTEMGIPHRHGIAGNGVLAIVEGRNPEKKTVALRADIDALPITEYGNKPYTSQNPGVMHACGHDAHTASLLGAARILHALRNEFEGTVKLLFQPAEEKLPGGATLMIKEGALENPRPSAIFGQHVTPPLPAGKVGFRPGPFMASADEIYVTVTGRGGHGAVPHDCIDPVLVASHLVVALQQVVSRNANPLTPSVLSFGKFIANGATNIIPNEVKLEGTFRTFDEKWRGEAHDKMTKMATMLCESMGASCEFNIIKGYPVLVNHETLTTRARAYAVEYLGAENVIDLAARMTAEDFAWYSHELPACFYRLGTGNPNKDSTHPLHTDRFDIDEDTLLIGAGLMAWIGLSELRVKSEE